ncbi:DUF300-domain-containing protein [Hygrophoropsis aurantiaca]|uniref:DUF300-domain-containing protein n=1 Tax=Hygrophoropsis aurantiaca TaxID=72124 RepID=A0ACB8AHU0_9AGAM|nr:DUF300-domain-containing protein [Hygrophoropsis aurantiaca]
MASLAEDDHGRGSGSSLPYLVLIIAGISTFIAVVVSGISIYLQLINYRKPLLQRMVVRIMVMVPIYAVSSLISLFSLDAAFFIDVIRDIYEASHNLLFAFVIYCFFVLLLDYLGGERSVLILLHGRPPKPAVFPVSLWRHEIDVSDPYMFLFLKRGILQYVQVKPLLAIVTVILKATGTYNEGDFRARSGYLYVSVIYNLSICLALYCLAVFWMCVSDDLKPFRPVPKFLCVKGILFFSFWQSICISFLVAVNVITRLGPYTDSEHISVGLTDSLICIEMPFFALAHMYAFSYRDFVKSSTGLPSGSKVPVYVARMRLGYALRDAFGLKDLVEDMRETLRGGGLTYREFEPSEGGMHIGAGRERRIRAGLRYSAGGKRKYWLPEINGLPDDSHGWLGQPAEEDVLAPLLASDAESAVHLAPDLQRQSQIPGDNISAEDEDEFALHFSDQLADVDENMYEHAKKYVFGDYAYPVVDVSSEEARRAMWDEEARVVREGVGFKPRHIGDGKNGDISQLRGKGYGATGSRAIKVYDDDEDEGFASDERVVDFEEGPAGSGPSGLKFVWTNHDKDKGRTRKGSASASASASSSSSGLGQQARSPNSVTHLNPHARLRTNSGNGGQSSNHQPNSPRLRSISNQTHHSNSSSPHSRYSPSQRPGTRTPLAEPDAVDLIIPIPEGHGQNLNVPPHAHSPLSHSPTGKLKRVWGDPDEDRYQPQHGTEIDIPNSRDSFEEGLTEEAIEERLTGEVPEVQDAEQVVRAITPPAYTHIAGYDLIGHDGDDENPWA